MINWFLCDFYSYSIDLVSNHWFPRDLYPYSIRLILNHWFLCDFDWCSMDLISNHGFLCDFGWCSMDLISNHWFLCDFDLCSIDFIMGCLPYLKTKNQSLYANNGSFWGVVSVVKIEKVLVLVVGFSVHTVFPAFIRLLYALISEIRQ